MIQARAGPSQLIYERPWLFPKQLEAIWCPERISIVEGGTKTGKTTGCMIWLAEQAMAGQPGRNYWWVSSVYATAAIAYERLKRGLPQAVRDPNDTKMTLTLANETVMSFKTAEKPDHLFGQDVYAAVGDEISRWREASWHALRSTLTATRGPVRLVGNVKGRKNWAYQLARQAEAGESDMRYTKFTAYDAVDAALLTLQDIEDAQKDLPEAVFSELYLCIPTDDGGNPFGLQHIAACVAPATSAPPSAWGWDLAKGERPEGDWTVGIALDASGHVCRFERWQGSWRDTIRRIVARTGRCPALVDSTGAGDPILEHLQAEAPNVFEGYAFSQASKQKLMEGLALAIQKGDIRYPDGPIRAELEAFEYEYTRTGVRYTAPSGMHDDCVCALTLAVHHWTAQSRVSHPYMWARNDPKIRARVEARMAARAPLVPDGMPAARIYFTEDGRAIERAGHPYGYLKPEAEQRAAAASEKPRESDEERMKRRVAAYKASQGL